MAWVCPCFFQKGALHLFYLFAFEQVGRLWNFDVSFVGKEVHSSDEKGPSWCSTSWMMDRKKYSLGFAPVHLSLGTGHDSGPGDGINCLFTELYVFVFNC